MTDTKPKVKRYYDYGGLVNANSKEREEYTGLLVPAFDYDSLLAKSQELEEELNRLTRGDVSNIITTLGDALTYIGKLEHNLELVLQHIENHSCASTCCDAQPSAGEAKALADCARRAIKQTPQAGKDDQ